MCQKEIEQEEFRYSGWYELEQADIGTIAMLCSPSCLVEFAWKLKEGQPKLSKSDVNLGAYQDMDGRHD